MSQQVTVTISIGTGIGRGHRKGQQQTAAEFDRFVAEVRELALERVHAEVYVDAARSFGTDELGQPEGGATFVAGVPVDYVAELRHRLRGLADVHDQRCIAVTVGTTEFVGPGAE